MSEPAGPDAPRAAPLAVQYRAFRDRAKAGRPMDFEALLRAFHGALLKPGDIAIDLGAYRGTHTIPMARAVRGPGGAVGAIHAFEPNPAVAAALRATLAKPGLEHVTLHEAAAAAEDGQADFVVALDAPGYSGLQRREYDQPDMRTELVRVWTAKLDTIFAALDRLAYIKLDLEGGEFDALRGGDALIRRLRPAISFEFGHRSYGAYGVDPGAVFDWFAERNYALFDIAGNALLTRERFLRSDSLPGLWDYLAVPNERRDLKRLARAQAALVEPAPPRPAPGPVSQPRCRILVVPGMAKAGTTFLFEQLGRQAEHIATTRNKEPNYFLRGTGLSRAEYLAKFRDPVPGKVLLDVSPTYIGSGAPVAERIRQVLPEDEVSVAILLRDPVDRLFSHYLHDLKSFIGRPSWDGTRPATFALTAPDVLARYTRPRTALVAGYKAAFGAACRGFHMGALFDGEMASALSGMLGIPVAPFDAGIRANPGGFVPAYLYGGTAGLAFEQDGTAYRVPPGALVFAANSRSELVEGIAPDAAAALVELGRSFTSELTLPRDVLAPLVEDHLATCRVLGLERRLEPRGAEVRFSAPRGQVSAAVLARLRRA
jgi:FkbM family methyltransferase